MGNWDQQDAGAEIHVPVYNTTQEDSQLTESDFGEDRISSTCESYPDVQICCSDDNEFVQSRHVDDEQVNVKHEDCVCSGQMCKVDVQLKTGLKTANRTEIETSNQEDILQFDDVDQLPQCIHIDNELIKVKQEMTDSDECDRDGEETRRWIVCEGGMLKEVKTEPTHSVSGKGFSENVDQVQQCNNNKHILQLLLTTTRSNPVPTNEVTQTSENPYTCDTCGKSFKRLKNLKLHKRTHTSGKPHSCDTCGKSFMYSSNLKFHKMTLGRETTHV